MKLATTTGDFYQHTGSQKESLKLIHEAGFRYADMNFGIDAAKRTGIYSDNFEAYFEDINKSCDEIGITLVQAHSPMGKPLVDGNVQFLEDTIRCVDACGAWGIPNLVVHSGYLPDISTKECFAKNKEFFSRILDVAEKYGVNILVENFDKMSRDNVYWIDNAPDLLSMIEYVNHPLFHAVWDTGHANMQEMPQDEALRLLGSHVRALHVHDNHGAHDEHLVPFLGSLNLDSLMTGLLDIGYDGYFTFEVGRFFNHPSKRRQFERETKLLNEPLNLRKSFERYLYELGKCVLETYGCYEI